MTYRIKEIREALRMTQDELSEKSGITKQTISKLESGDDAEVKVGTLKAIADAFGVKVSVLFD